MDLDVINISSTHSPSPPVSVSRLTAVVLVVPSDLLAAQRRRCGLHSGGS